MKLTTFEFFKDTPLTDLKNTIYFKSNEERDDFFSKTYDSIKLSSRFNFIRDRGTIKVTGNVREYGSVNYCRFKTDFEGSPWYYCFIPEFKYINDEVIELNLMLDGIMTYCQDKVLNNLQGIKVIRQHLTKTLYDLNLDYLKNNDDVIKTQTKKYFYKEKKEFIGFNVLIQSSVDLSTDFGTVDNPNINTSSGGIVDDIASPVDLYLVDELEFNNVMTKLKRYPWITQNFKKIILIPKDIINKDMKLLDTEEVSNPTVDLHELYKIKNGLTDPFNDFLKDLNKSNEELLNLFNLEKGQDEHLLRNEYTTIELYNWTGGRLLINAGQLPEKGLEFKTLSIGGYENELSIYIADYKSRMDGIGSFLNDSISFNSFDDIPILIDSYNLALSKSANIRKYGESNLLTNKVGRILDPNNNLQDRLVSAVGILSNISPMSLGQGLMDEHEYYRRQKAEHLDMALTPPEITPSIVTNGLVKKSNNYGVTMLMSKPSPMELKKIKNYYKLFGYEVEGSTMLSDTRSMSICNYLQFEGSYNIKGVERSIMDIIKIQFENGVRLWHNNNTPNPFIQDISNNKMIK